MPASGVPGAVLRGLQTAAGILVLTRLARGRSRRAPLAVPAIAPEVDLSVIVPARDEAKRIGSLDADTRPRRGLGQALAAALEDADLISAGARFICETAGERWLHPAMLLTLIYRFGPPDAVTPVRPARLMVAGQCTAVRRQALLDAGGYVHSAGHMTDDAAQARALARLGWRIAFHDGGGLIAVDNARIGGRDVARVGTFAGVARRHVAALADPRRGGGVAGARACAAAGAGRPRRPAGRHAAGAALDHGDSCAGSYDPRGLPYWLSPLADPLGALRLTISAVRPARDWRGRVYGAGP